MQGLEQQIIDLLVEVSGDEEAAEELDMDLFEEDILDSMAAIELLVALKDRFGVSIAPTELEREEMNTVNKIIDRVRERM